MNVVSPKRATLEDTAVLEYISSEAIARRGTLRIGESIQVQVWERPAQEAMADLACAIKPISLLELGYGLGLASRQIRKHAPLSLYLSFEMHPSVACHAINELCAIQNAQVVCGVWQNSIDSFAENTFSAIIDDAYLPFGDHYAASHYLPATLKSYIYADAKRLQPFLMNDGRLLFLDVTSSVEFSAAEVIHLGYMSLRSHYIMVNIPKSCTYASGTCVKILEFRK